MKKQKNNKLRSKLYRTAGYATIGGTSIGGVSVYNFAIQGHEDVAVELQNAFQMFADNIWVEQGSYKLNIVLALPFLIGLVVWMIILQKKNKEFFKDKLSLSLLILIAILYLVYSTIGYVMSTLIGALVGVMISEFGLEPLANYYQEEAEFDKDLKKEKRRERVRREVQKEDELDGIV